MAADLCPVRLTLTILGIIVTSHASDQNTIANLDAQAGLLHLRPAMKSGVLNRGAAELDRFQFRYRR